MTRTAETTLDQTPPATPLAAEEISHLIETARAETYRASESVPVKEVGTFKAKSLMDLAREASLKEARPDPEPAPEVVAEAPEEAAEAEAQADDIPEAELVAEPEAPLAAEEPPPSEPDTSEPAPAPPEPAQPMIDAEMLERVRAEAFAAGQADARRADSEGPRQALAVLEAAARALTSPPEGAMVQLRASIAASVKQLASARAGQAIDDLPEPFMTRIEDLADRVHACASAPVLRLHPDDLDAIADFVSQSDLLSGMRMVASADLARGDVELTLDGLAVTDRLEPLEGRRRRMVFAHGGIKPAAEAKDALE